MESGGCLFGSASVNTPSKWPDTEIQGLDRHGRPLNVKHGVVRLTALETRVLQGLRDGKDFVCARPGGWYQEHERIAGRVGKSLLRKAFITSDNNERLDALITHYQITTMGQQALDGDPVPLVEAIWGHLL